MAPIEALVIIILSPSTAALSGDGEGAGGGERKGGLGFGNVLSGIGALVTTTSLI
jgi:hypothetical protein